jgi:NADPH2:quinone reductase
MTVNAKFELVLVYTIPIEAKQAAVAAITQALKDEALSPLPVARYRAAHDAVEAGGVGKLLVDIP